MEFINAFKNTLQINIPYKILNRRNGDIAECYCTNDKALKILKWTPKKTINDLCSDSWNFIRK